MRSLIIKMFIACLPGSIVHVGRGSFSKQQFWNPEEIADIRFANDDDYVEAFKERLDKAVRASLRSCRPPCATITGGLDSSSIAVSAADILAANGSKLNTFTAVPEAGFARRRVARALLRRNAIRASDS